MPQNGGLTWLNNNYPRNANLSLQILRSLHLVRPSHKNANFIRSVWTTKRLTGLSNNKQNRGEDGTTENEISFSTLLKNAQHTKPNSEEAIERAHAPDE